MSYRKCMKMYREYFEFDDSTDDNTREERQVMIKKKSNAKTFEIKEVQQLDSYIMPFSRSSGIIEKLDRKRKMRHEELMKKLADDLNGVNEKTEENIRISSEEVKAHMKNYRDRLSDKLRQLDEPQVASYHESVFLDIQKEASEMKSHQLRLVQELYDDLKKFENFRSTENERIFHSSFKQIEKTAYILPYELQSIIEHEALKMNQLTLNNRRCYEDLRLKLTLVTEQTFKSFMDEVFCLKEKWLRNNMQEALNEQCEHKEEPKFTVQPKPQTRLELERHVLLLNSTPDKCFDVATEEEWMRNTCNVSNTLENTTNMLIDVYKQVITAVHKDMKNEYDELRKSLLSLDRIQFEERTIQPILFESTNIDEEDIAQLELYWQCILRNVKGKLEDTYDCLTNFGELWDRHASRLCESKILVLKAVEKAEENSGCLLQELEVKGNLSLDALRQECNEAKLDTLYIATVANLDAIKEKLESDYINEVTVAENYYKMMNLEADVLSSEIKEFIYLKLSKEPEEVDNPEEMKPELGEDRANAVSLCTRMEEFYSETASLAFWKSELRIALENFADNTRERVSWRAENWVNCRVKEISRKYQMKMEMHHKRYDRIRIQTYEVRRQEIYLHQKIFDEHKAGVEDLYKKLTETVENFYNKFTEKLEESRIRVAAIDAACKKEDRAASVRCTQTQMQKQKAEFMTEVAMKAEQTQQEIEFRSSSVQQSNLKFMKSIKLFHENGNYEVDEAKMYITSLEGIDKEINNEVKSAIRETRKRETEILQKASEVFDEAIRTLMQLDEELQFHASVTNVLQLCKNDFVELSASLIADFDSLNKYSTFIGTSIAGGKRFLSRKEDGLWFLLISTLYKNVGNLFYTLELPQWLENASDEGEGNNSERGKCRASQGIKGKDPTFDFPLKDFSEEIFETGFLTDSTPSFMNAVRKKCCDYLNDLQRSGYAFYKNLGSKSLIRGDLLKPNHEEFLTDVCQLFHSFALECETLWLQVIHGFFPILADVKTLLKTYFEKRVREYVENVTSVLDDFYTEFTNSFNKNSCRMLSELQRLDNKMLPLHGHPRNSHLLTALEDEVVERTAEMELSWEIFTKDYDIQLKSIRKLCKAENEDYQALNLLYTESKNALSVEKLGKSLLDFAEFIVESRGVVKKIWKTVSKVSSAGEALLPYVTATSNAEFCGVPQTGNPSQRRKLKLYHLEGGLEDAETYFAGIKKIIQRETAKIPLEADRTIDMDREDWMNLLEPKLGLLNELGEFEDIMESQLKRIKNIYREIKEFIRSKTNFHKEILSDWLDKWKRNLEKNLELYTVKYPQAEDDGSDHFSDGSKDKGKFQRKRT